MGPGVRRGDAARSRTHLFLRSSSSTGARAAFARGGLALLLDRDIYPLYPVLQLCRYDMLDDPWLPAHRRVADAAARPPATRQHASVMGLEFVRDRPLDLDFGALPVPLRPCVLCFRDRGLQALLRKFGVPQRRHGTFSRIDAAPCSSGQASSLPANSICVI